MEKNIDQANHYAKMSCSRWNKPKSKFGKKLLDGLYGISRKRYRKKYWKLAIKSYRESMADGITIGNTYPWPYRDPDFATWDESDDADDCSLVLDKSGCIVKHATSYCAWKIFESTGSWPRQKSHIRINMKNWRQFLKEAGYDIAISGSHLSNRYNYVGIDPSYGKRGLVVWFEGVREDSENSVWISTYQDKKFVSRSVDAGRFTWIQII